MAGINTSFFYSRKRFAACIPANNIDSDDGNTSDDEDSELSCRKSTLIVPVDESPRDQADLEDAPSDDKSDSSESEADWSRRKIINPDVCIPESDHSEDLTRRSISPISDISSPYGSINTSPDEILLKEIQKQRLNFEKNLKKVVPPTSKSILVSDRYSKSTPKSSHNKPKASRKLVFDTPVSQQKKERTPFSKKTTEVVSASTVDEATHQTPISKRTSRIVTAALHSNRTLKSTVKKSSWKENAEPVMSKLPRAGSAFPSPLKPIDSNSVIRGVDSEGLISGSQKVSQPPVSAQKQKTKQHTLVSNSAHEAGLLTKHHGDTTNQKLKSKSKIPTKIVKQKKKQFKDPESESEEESLACLRRKLVVQTDECAECPNNTETKEKCSSAVNDTLLNVFEEESSFIKDKTVNEADNSRVDAIESPPTPSENIVSSGTASDVPGQGSETSKQQTNFSNTSEARQVREAIVENGRNLTLQSLIDRGEKVSKLPASEKKRKTKQSLLVSNSAHKAGLLTKHHGDTTNQKLRSKSKVPTKIVKQRKKQCKDPESESEEESLACLRRKLVVQTDECAECPNNTETKEKCSSAVNDTLLNVFEEESSFIKDKTVNEADNSRVDAIESPPTPSKNIVSSGTASDVPGQGSETSKQQTNFSNTSEARQVREAIVENDRNLTLQSLIDRGEKVSKLPASEKKRKTKQSLLVSNSAHKAGRLTMCDGHTTNQKLRSKSKVPTKIVKQKKKQCKDPESESEEESLACLRRKLVVQTDECAECPNNTETKEKCSSAINDTLLNVFEEESSFIKDKTENEVDTPRVDDTKSPPAPSLHCKNIVSSGTASSHPCQASASDVPFPAEVAPPAASEDLSSAIVNNRREHKEKGNSPVSRTQGVNDSSKDNGGDETLSPINLDLIGCDIPSTESSLAAQDEASGLLGTLEAATSPTSPTERLGGMRRSARLRSKPIPTDRQSYGLPQSSESESNEDLDGSWNKLSDVSLSFSSDENVPERRVQPKETEIIQSKTLMNSKNKTIQQRKNTALQRTQANKQSTKAYSSKQAVPLFSGSATDDQSGCVANAREEANADVPTNSGEVVHEGQDEEWKRGDIVFQNNFARPDFCTPHSIKEPIKYFEYYFNSELVDLIVQQTNLYSTQEKTKCINVTSEEIRAFFGILIYMGLCILPAIEDYWSSSFNIPQVFQVMNCKRFQNIRASIHFVNNREIPDNNYDRFYKVRPLLDHVRKKCQNLEFEYDFSVDESMVAYKGTRAGTLRQYMPDKPNKWGFKFFLLAGTSGITYDFIPYSGPHTFTPENLSPRETEMGVGAQAVIALCKSIPHPELATVTFDNYYTGLPLITYLRNEMKLFSLGTIRNNRLHSCTSFPEDKVLLKKGRGFSESRVNKDGVVIVKWADNKVVSLAGTTAGIEPRGFVRRYDKELKTKTNVPCPRAVLSYNQNMGGVDLCDQLMSLYKCPGRARRWYFCIIGYMLDLTLTNAYLTYKRENEILGLKPTYQNFKMFRLSVSQSLIAGNQRSKGRPSLDKSLSKLKVKRPVARRPVDELRLDEVGHWPAPCTRNRCKYCKIGNIRTKCVKCEVELCIVPGRNCFTQYHIEK